MAYSFLSRFCVKAACEDEFVGLARKMEALAASESGTLAFKFFRLDGPGMFAVYESFVDEAADKAHQQTAHGRPLIERMVACMDGGYARELLFDLEPST